MIRNRLQAFVRLVFASLAGTAVLGLLGCSDQGTGVPIDYDEIDPIVFSAHILPILEISCNTSFCHDQQTAASGLDLTSYQKIADGSRFGAMVTPFKPDFSHFYLHTTGAITPQMPLGRDPLPDDQIRFLRRWIENGARDDLGEPMYSGVTRKAFVACQGENSVAIVDMDTEILVGLFDVDQPHSVYVDEANDRLYVSRFETASDNLHMYDANTLELLATGQAGTFPALMMIPSGTQQLWVTNFDTTTGDHAVRVFDPVTLEQIRLFDIPSVLQPHGIAATEDGSLVYTTNILSDDVSIFTTSPLGVLASTIPLPDVGSPAGQQPQQCVLSADETRLFVSALGSDRVHVMDTSNGQWTAEVMVGEAPWHLALNPLAPELWVANWKGETISVIDVTNPDLPSVVATLDPVNPEDPERPALERPIGISFSPDGSQVYVTSANDDNEGSGHHPTPDGEKAPGAVTIFDATTREVVSVAEVPNFARFVSFLP